MKEKKFSILNLSPCLLAIIIDAMGFGLVYPLLGDIFINTNTSILPLETTTALRNFYLGLGFLLYPLFMFFGVAFLGDLSDILGRKKILSIAIFGLFLSYLLMGVGILSKSLLLFFVGRGLSGLASGSEAVSQAAVIDMSTKENKHLNMSKISLTVCLGLILGPLVGGFFSDREMSGIFGLYTPFFVASLLALVSFFWLSFGFKETFYPKKRKDYFRSLKVFIEAIKHSKIRLLLGIELLFQTGFGIYYQMMSLFLREKMGFSTSDIGYFYVVLGLGFATGLLFVLKLLSKKFSSQKIAAIMILIMGMMQFVSASVFITLWIIIIAFITAMTNSVAYNELMVTFSNEVEEDKQGWVMGIYCSILAIAYVIVGFITNLLSVLSLQNLFMIGAFLSVLSSFLLYLMYRKLIKVI